MSRALILQLILLGCAAHTKKSVVPNQVIIPQSCIVAMYADPDKLKCAEVKDGVARCTAMSLDIKFGCIKVKPQ